MKRMAKLLFASILIGLIIGAVSATAVAQSPDDVIGVGDKVAAAAASSGVVSPDGGAVSKLAPDATNVFVKSVYVYVNHEHVLTKYSVNPATGGTITITGHDIVTMSLYGYYTGPTGTYGQMILYDLTGMYPQKGVPRITDGVALAKSTTATKVSTKPLWNNWDNLGTYNMYVWVYGNNQAVSTPITFIINAA